MAERYPGGMNPSPTNQPQKGYGGKSRAGHARPLQGGDWETGCGGRLAGRMYAAPTNGRKVYGYGGSGEHPNLKWRKGRGR